MLESSFVANRGNPSFMHFYEHLIDFFLASSNTYYPAITPGYDIKKQEQYILLLAS